MTDVQKDTTLDQVKDVIADDMNAWMYYSQAIAATMSNRMEELGMTQRALAEKMNCTQQYVSKVLKGRENLSLETLCKIENALGIKIPLPYRRQRYYKLLRLHNFQVVNQCVYSNFGKTLCNTSRAF